LNESYSEVAHFNAIGYPEREILLVRFDPILYSPSCPVADLHELFITPDDHVLVTVYTPKQTDLTELGGASDGWIFENTFQEINLDTDVCAAAIVCVTLATDSLTNYLGTGLLVERQRPRWMERDLQYHCQGWNRSGPIRLLSYQLGREGCEW
jgi:Arylsulfotransferase (ASST)